MDESKKKRFQGLMEDQASQPQRLEDLDIKSKLAGMQAGAEGGSMMYQPPQVKQPPVPTDNRITQDDSNRVRAAQLSLLANQPKQAIAPNAQDLQNDKFDSLENAAQFDDQNAKDELKRLAPDRFQKLFGQ